MYERSPAQGVLRQGEIITDIIQYLIRVDSLRSGEDLEVESRKHPIAIVLTQDCDLDWDYKARQDTNVNIYGKLIPNILLCEVETAEHLRQNVPRGRDLWKLVTTNRDERYHFFHEVGKEYDCLGEGLPELGCDFKRYFTLPPDEIYWSVENKIAARRCILCTPYMQHFVSRFFIFQSRIALPEQNE